MNGFPVLLKPEGTHLIAVGSGGIIYQDPSNPDQVVKAPVKHDIKGCSDDAIKSVQNEEDFSDLCMTRENLIYRTLPKDSNILDFIAITEGRLHFPYMRLGNLRDYLQNHADQLHILP